jgi:hypothetical protein
MSFAIEKEERFAAYNAQMCLRHARQVRKEIHDKFVSPVPSTLFPQTILTSTSMITLLQVMPN